MTSSSSEMKDVITRAKTALLAIQKIEEGLTEMENFIRGGNLRDFRKATGLTQEKAALAAGVSLRTWITWEKGRARPLSFEPFKKLCEHIIKQR